MKDIHKILEAAYSRGLEAAKQGKVATYIPELGKADPMALGISICLPDGTRYEIGETEKRFSIQSISKVITLALALKCCGVDAVFEKVGMEPSGEAFNSLVELDLRSNRPFNPMINSGAITVVSMLKNHISVDELLAYTRRVCMDPEITFNEAVYESEMNHLSRNRSIAYLLESKGIIMDVEESLQYYTRACSMNVTARDLATLGVVLAKDGRKPHSIERFIDSRIVEIIKTIMVTCGMYDGSGEFAVRVGIPTKSGVGGGLLSVSHDKLGIGIYGPSLDEKGNCIAGRPILELLADELQLKLFEKGSIVEELEQKVFETVVSVNEKLRH